MIKQVVKFLLVILLLITLWAVLCLVKYYKNRYVVFSIFGTCGISLAILMTIMAFVVSGNYHYLFLGFFSFDYEIFRAITELKISYYDTILYKNIGIFIYLVSICLLIYSLIYETNLWKRVITLVVMLIFPITYIFYYHPATGLEFFVKYNTGGEEIKELLMYIDQVFNYAKVVFTFVPNIILLLYFQRASVWVRKRQLLYANLYIFLLNLLFGALFIFGIFKTSYTNNGPDFLQGMESLRGEKLKLYMGLATAFLLAIQFIYVMVGKYRLFETGGDLKNFYMNRYRKMGTDIRNSYHFIKNTLFNIEILARKAAETDNLEDKNAVLQKIGNISHVNTEKIIYMMKAFNNKSLDDSEIQISDVIEFALKSIDIPLGIKVIKVYKTPEAKAVCDFFYLSEAFVNVFKNSIEAIQVTGRKDGVIEIALDCKEGLVVVDISDNGNGISKETLSEVFKPMFTTKSRDTNWGIGLFYVYRIINAHNGFVRIDSTEHSGTNVNIVLCGKE